MTRLYALQALAHTRTQRGRWQLQLRPAVDARLDELIQKIKFEPDVAKRNGPDPRGPDALADEAFFIPLHHQIRPWAMKPGVETLHPLERLLRRRATQG